jgi:hypothetical protein
MEAYRTSCVFDGERFLEGGGTVLVDRGLVAGVESYGFPLPTGEGGHDRRDIATDIDAVLDPQQVVLAGQPVLERGSTR